MSKFYKKGLAFLLAVAMVMGDFLPAAAAELPEEAEIMEASEVTEETEVTEATKMEEADVTVEGENTAEEPAESVEPADTPEAEAGSGQEETETVVEVTEETAEASVEEQAADTKKTLVLDEEMIMEANTGDEYYFTPSQDGYYYFETDGYVFGDCYDSQYTYVGTIAVPSNGELIPETCYLEAGKTYHYVMNQCAMEGETPPDYSVFYFRRAENVPEISTLTLDEDGSVTLKAGSDALIKISGQDVKYYLCISGDSSSYYESGMGSGTVVYEENDTVWRSIYLYGDCYIALCNVSSDVELILSEKMDFCQEITDWTEPITLGAGETGYYSFDLPTMGDYLFPVTEEIKFTFLDSSMGTEECSGRYGGKQYEGFYGCSEELGSQNCTFSLQNTGNEEVTIQPVTHRELCETPEDITVDQEITFTNESDGEIHYYSFTASADKTMLYRFYEWFTPDWILDEEEKYVERSSYFVPEPGKTYLLRVKGAAGNTFAINPNATEATGTSLTVSPGVIYAFTPSESGMYGTSEQVIEWWDSSICNWSSWRYRSGVKAYALELQEGVTYLIRSYASKEAQVNIKRNVTVLDYDYYNAFLASGGSVSINEDGSASILKGGASWVLKQATADVVGGVSCYDSANLYWKNSKSGAFTAKRLYRIVGEGEEQTLEPVQESEVQEGETVVVEYGPKIVWAKSITLSVERNQTTLEVGDQTQLSVALGYGQTKYLPDEATEISWYSSDPDIAEVDGETGLVTAKAQGNVTISAFADSTLRSIERYYNPNGNYPIAKASINLTICEKAELNGLEIVIPGMETDGDGINYLNLELPYNNDTGFCDLVTVYASVRTTPSSIVVPLSEINWEFNGIPVDTNAFTFDMGGDYTITASYGEEYTDSIQVHVTEEAAPVLQRGQTAEFIKNAEPSLTFKDIREFLNQKLGTYDDGVSTRILYKDSKGTVIESDKELSQLLGTKKEIVLTAELYKINPETSEWDLADSTNVTIVYDNVTLTGYETSNGTVVGVEDGKSGYENNTYVAPELSYHGAKYTLEEFESAYNGGFSSFGLEAIVEDVSNEEVLYAVVEGSGVRVSGILAGKSTLTMSTQLVLYGEENSYIKLGSKKISFTVVEGRAVSDVMVLREDYGWSLNESMPYQLQASEVESAAKEVKLIVSAHDCSGVPYEDIRDAKLKWSTTNAKIAKVTVDSKTGEATLVIPKGASGVANITVTANDSQKRSLTFQVNVLDTDVRLDTTSLTLNSYRNESGTIYLYPNLLGAGGSLDSLDIQITPVKKVGSGKNVTYEEDESIFTLDTYKKDKGYVAVHFVESAQKAGKYTLTLKIQQTINSEVMDPVYKTVTITNKPALPKTTVKQTVNYNTYWKNEEAYAKLLVTTAESVSTENISLVANEYYELAGEVIDLGANQYELHVKAADGTTPSTRKVPVQVAYDDYAIPVTVSVSLKAGSVAPAFTVYGVDAYSPSFYPELGEGTVQVLVDIPDSMEKESFSLELTQTAAKYFSITGQTVEDDCRAVDKNGNEISLGKAVLVTLNPYRLAGGTAQFTVTSKDFSKGAATTKSLKITAKKVSAVKASLENTVNGSRATAYTFQQQLADSEYLSLRPVITDETLNFYTSYAAADKATEAAMKAGQLVIKKTVDSNGNESYLLKATPELYDIKGLSKCKVKVTTYVSSEHGHGGTKALSAVTLTLSLKKQTKAAAVTATAKVSGSLNVVDPDSSVTITPTIKNLPLGAEICSIEFADKADRALYELSNADYITGKVTLSQAAAGEEEDKQALPIGKDSVGILYGYQMTDGSYGTVMAAASVNVVQIATVKADVKTLTLYNAAPGEAYGKLVTIDVTKAGAAKIASLEITGLEGSGITWKPNENLNELRFYVDEEASRGIEKAYKAKVIVTLENAGTQKGKTVTYTVPITITLKK